MRVRIGAPLVSSADAPADAGGSADPACVSIAPTPQTVLICIMSRRFSGLMRRSSLRDVFLDTRFR